ncbi:hypothetical protein [Clostridium brassicae]|uniref:Uncharacterized protein n=1 Tax=Clostridium brassicae TaxID=2999072 RepID=A0ABT4D8R8_9CLOT|nr:hypothetical protein [Clostridium brassicae]MCY6958690.1 hypothetical protein [Clostridium brassicae]
MDKDIKDLLLNLQSEVTQINNRLDEIEKTPSTGNYVYTNEDINSKQKS